MVNVATTGTNDARNSHQQRGGSYGPPPNMNPVNPVINDYLNSRVPEPPSVDMNGF